ncbi:MAG: ribonuclease P protein component [Nocardioidaceae bacterium]
MLARVHRLRRSAEFRHVVQRGHRVGCGTIVVHAVQQRGGAPARLGFVVSKAVGAATVRNKVKRRLRHASRPWLDELSGAAVVIRANPAAAEVSFARLSSDVGRCLQRAHKGLA